VKRCFFGYCCKHTALNYYWSKATLGGLPLRYRSFPSFLINWKRFRARSGSSRVGTMLQYKKPMPPAAANQCDLAHNPSYAYWYKRLVYSLVFLFQLGTVDTNGHIAVYTGRASDPELHHKRKAVGIGCNMPQACSTTSTRKPHIQNCGRTCTQHRARRD
jgi:hypothetical protein